MQSLRESIQELSEYLKLSPQERQAWACLQKANPPPKEILFSGQEERSLPKEEPERKAKPSQRRQNLAQKMAEARLARERSEQEMGIGLRPLVMCGMPLRKVQGSLWSRRCGEYQVDIVAHPRYGLPFGQDRLIPLFVATLFVYQGCPPTNEVRFSSVREMLRLFGLPVDGKTYRRFQEGFERISKSFFSLERTFLSRKGKTVREIENIPLLRKIRLWYDEDLSCPPDTEVENIIRLDEALAKEIREHPIPVDLQVVQALATFPGALDLYQWQIWRSFSIKKETRVPLLGEIGLFSQLGFLKEQPIRELRRRVKDWQQKIRFLWKDCPNDLSRDGKAFLLRPAKALGHLEANRFLLQRIHTRKPRDPGKK